MQNQSALYHLLPYRHKASHVNSPFWSVYSTSVTPRTAHRRRNGPGITHRHKSATLADWSCPRNPRYAAHRAGIPTPPALARRAAPPPRPSSTADAVGHVRPPLPSLPAPPVVPRHPPPCPVASCRRPAPAARCAAAPYKRRCLPERSAPLQSVMHRASSGSGRVDAAGRWAPRWSLVAALGWAGRADRSLGARRRAATRGDVTGAAWGTTGAVSASEPAVTVRSRETAWRQGCRRWRRTTPLGGIASERHWPLSGTSSCRCLRESQFLEHRFV